LPSETIFAIYSQHQKLSELLTALNKKEKDTTKKMIFQDVNLNILLKKYVRKYNQPKQLQK